MEKDICNKIFPIGFWNYTKCNILDVKESVSDWAKLGMNVAMSSYYSGEEDKEYILKSLDEAYAQGVKMIICDKRTCWLYYTEFGEEEYKKAAKQAVEDFGWHPAFLAFSVGDEPHIDEWDDMKKSVKIINSMSNAFVNFLPLYDQSGPEWYGIKYDGYADLIVETIKETGLFVVSYDCYTQCNYHFSEKGIDEYFKNLTFYQDVAKRAGVPLWNTVLSVGHWMYHCPTVDDLRWQIYTSVAHGVNGLLWFFIYERSKDSSYRQAPINLFYEKTAEFDTLSFENRVFAKCYAENFIGSTLKEVYHFGKTYAGVKQYENGVISGLKFKGEYNSSLIISVFEDKNKKTFVTVTNNEQRNIEHLTGEYNGKTINEWFAPGQMTVIK